MADATIAEVISLLNRGDAPDCKYPDYKGEYWGLCPFHEDSHTGSFSVSDRGYKCWSCGAAGGLNQLADRLAGGSFPSYAARPKGKSSRSKMQFTEPEIDLTQYAAAKRLPVEFLQGLGLRTGRFYDRKVVEMPYYDVDGTLLRNRYRISMAGSHGERFRWGKSTGKGGAYPYGLWKLPSSGQSIVLVEGESDTQTLWYHGINALGIPGSSSWRSEWAVYLNRLRVYVWQEPDEAGEKFVASLAALRPIVIKSSRWKDVSECHVKTGKVPQSVRRVKLSALGRGK